VSERERLATRYEETGAMSAPCREFGIGRKTGYEWFGRYFELGAAGLADRSLVRGHGCRGLENAAASRRPLRSRSPPMSF
jgi:hypothetical protein